MSMTLTMVALSVAVTGTCSISSIRTFLKFRQEEKELVYSKNFQGVYEVDLGGQPESEELVQELISLEEEYGFNVQEFTYQRLKEHLSSEGMEVHSEEVLEDNTIKIVLNV